MCFSKYLIKSIMVHPYHRILLCLLKEQVCLVCTGVAESLIYNEKSNVPRRGLGLLPIVWACVFKEIYTYGLEYAFNNSRRINRN